MLRRFIWHWAVLALGLYLLTRIRALGISYDQPSDLIWASLVLILVNTFVRPVLVFFTLPLVLLTLGFFLLVINALMLELLPHLVAGFHVPGFTAAFFGALLLSLVTWIFRRSGRRTATVRRAPARRQEIIDV